MTDDVIAAKMAELRLALIGGDHEACYQAGRAAWGALDAALSVHRKGSRVIYASACHAHLRTGADPACTDCEPERRSETCAGCRDEDGDYLLFADCQVRAAVLAALTGKGGGNA